MPYEIIATPSNYYKRILSTFSTTGSGYKLSLWGLSARGHDPNDPSIALAVDPSATVMPGGAPLYGPALIDEYRFQADYCAIYIGKLAAGEYSGDLSSVALFGEVTFQNSVDDPIVGTQFLAAVGNRPLISLVSADSAEFHISLFF